MTMFGTQIYGKISRLEPREYTVKIYNMFIMLLNLDVFLRIQQSRR